MFCEVWATYFKYHIHLIHLIPNSLLIDFLNSIFLQVSLVALSFWSFHFASLCAFGLLAYVGYIIYAFPSLFRLHRLNGLLLVFILLWAVSTYIFNVAFTFLNWKLGRVILILIAAIFIRQVFFFLISRQAFIWIVINVLFLFTGHENLGNGGSVALSNTWFFFACTILSWNFGCIGKSCEQFCFPLLVWWGWANFKRVFVSKR